MTKKDAMEIAIRKMPVGTSTKKIVEECDRIYNVHNSPSAREVKNIGTGRDLYMSKTSRNDVSHLNNPCLTTINSLTAPSLTELATSSISEYMPEIWNSLCENSFERAIAIRVYEEVRSKVLRNAYRL